MKRFFCLLCLLFSLCIVQQLSAEETAKSNDLLVLCYHDISLDEVNDSYFTVSQRKFLQQLQFLRRHGYNFVSVDDVIAAKNGQKRLPDKAVLLSFDDAYRSFYTFVHPTLKRLGYPSMLAVVGRWTEENNLPEDMGKHEMMSWEEIAEVGKSGMVEVASHSWDLHKSVRYTPAGNVAAATTSRLYLPERRGYESDAEYRARLDRDFAAQREIFQKRLGRAPRVMVWPYGRYNVPAIEAARKAGAELTFNLSTGSNSWLNVDHPLGINRLIVDNWSTDVFSYFVRKQGQYMADPVRAAQVDLDLIYDAASAETTEANLGKLIDRLVALEVNTVFLQAFSDDDASGNIKSVYFHNRVLPVKADIFSHAVHQIRIRGMSVYAWMPTLGIVFPDAAFNERYRVREYKNGQVAPSGSWYQRLTPFSPEVRQRVAMLYEDLAAYNQIDGVLFQDDAYLNDFEDAHPLALQAFAQTLNGDVGIERLFEEGDMQDRWTAFKTAALNGFIDDMISAVRRFRPESLVARNIYAEPVLNTNAETWFAQNWEDYLEKYDYAVVMAYPRMEKAKNDKKWLRNLARTALQHKDAYPKAVFKLQTYDWDAKTWVDSDALLDEMRAVLASGVRNLAYYPDNVWDDAPRLNTVRLEMSTRTTPK